MNTSDSNFTEYTIVAAGKPENCNEKQFLGRFPLGLPNKPAGGKAWSVRQEVDKDNAAGPPVWLMHDKSGKVSHKGTEGDPSSNVGYFVLVSTGERQFSAVPVHGWYNFRPVVQHEVLSLEEAEELMRLNKRPKVAKSIAERLNKVAEKMQSENPTEEGKEKEFYSDDSDFDEEREGKRKKKKENAVKPKEKPEEQKVEHDESSGDEGGGGGDEEGEKLRPDGVEDWEFEEEHADDDLNMGDADLDDDEATAELRKFVESDSSDEGEEELNESGKKLKKLLKKTGLDTDSDKDDDVEDLDEMAKGAGALLEKAKSRGPKRKATETTTAKAQQPSDSPPPAKKPKNSSQKAKPKPQVKLADPKSIELSEIVTFLRQRGPLPLEQLIGAFRKVIATQEDQKKFKGIVKKVAEFTEHPAGSGNKLVSIKKPSHKKKKEK